MVSFETRSRYISTVVDAIINRTSVRVKDIVVKGDRVIIALFQCPGKRVCKEVKRIAIQKLKTEIKHNCERSCEMTFTMKDEE